MNAEGFARLAFEAHHDDEHGEGGWEAWEHRGPKERAPWLKVGEMIENLIDGQVTGRKAAEDAPGSGPQPAARYALVEQMGHRATVGTVRETTFLGKPMLEVTDLRTGRTSLAAPESLYGLTWLTEDDARAQVRPWTAVALPAAAMDDDDDPETAANGGVWGFTEADL